MFSGDSLKARSARGMAMTILSIGGTNGLRLLSNLVLTRLLFPEAFGLMALVQVFIVGLGMFSDTGIRTSIIRSERGDDPDFLNTAWTMQIMRGCLLWVCACALAYPVALFYEQPLLAQILPIAGLNQLIQGFATTNVASSNRHLHLGRLTIIDLVSQLLGIVVMVVLAYLLQSVWSLVIGGVVSSIIKIGMQQMSLPGIRNRLRLERAAFSELFSFGQFIFLSTAITFVMAQGDKAILGFFISIQELGVYNIGYFLGSIPFVLCSALTGKVILPLYRMKPITGKPANKRKIFRARRAVIGGSLLFCVIMGYAGPWLVDLMYDDRYSLAGPIVVLLSLTLVPRIVVASYGGVLLSAGDSQRFFYLNLSVAILQTLFMLIGAHYAGIFGVLVGPPLSLLLTHPQRVSYVRKYDGWDPVSDAIFLVAGLTAGGVACWLHWDEILLLIS